MVVQMGLVGAGLLVKPFVALVKKALDSEK
jgi:hypothetical protein